MDPTTITASTFTVTGPGLVPVTGNVTYDPTNTIATFAPTGIFIVGTEFTATITTRVKSLGGASLAADFAWNFTTGASTDTTDPRVTFTTPADLGTAVGTNQKIAATFSEGMDSSTLTAVTFTLTGPGAAPVAGAVTYSTIGTTAIFTPSSALAVNTMFTATIAAGVQDLAGNPLKSAFTWSFTTGATTDSVAPAISSTNPADSATNVSLDAAVNATFSEAIDPSTPLRRRLRWPGLARRR